jgi:3D (Asp-Asp-Asp) domain-containing protein
MTRSPMFWLLLAAAGVASYPIFKVEAHNERTLQAADTQDDQHSAKYAGRHETTRVFRISAYCKNSCCCPGTADGITANGHRIVPSDYGRICAAPAKYAFGTTFEIPGTGRVRVLDRGGAIKAAGDRVKAKDGKYVTLEHDRLDLLLKTHREAQEWGVKYLEVRIQGE